MTPATALIYAPRGFEIPRKSRFTPVKTLDEVKQLVRIPESEQSAVWNGHQFEVPRLHVFIGGSSNTHEIIRVDLRDKDLHEWSAELYYPIDPRIRTLDVDGATVAYPNETNTGWLFRHCDADYHHDHELRLRAAVSATFENEIDLLMREAVSGNAKSRAKWQSLVFVRDAVILATLKDARDKPLGWYQRNAHESHVHAQVTAGIEAAEKLLATVNPTILNEVQAQVTSAKSLIASHTYETRWERDARLAAEAKAAAEKAAAESESGNDAETSSEGEGA